MPCSSHSVSCIENGEIVPAGLVKHISTCGEEIAYVGGDEIGCDDVLVSLREAIYSRLNSPVTTCLAGRWR